MKAIQIIVFLIFGMLLSSLRAQSCATDNRTPTSHAAVGRIVINNNGSGSGWAPGTAWILPNGKLVTAGHVMSDFLGSGGVIIVEFNVPLSDPNTGQMTRALDEDRYVVDQSTIQMADGGLASGNDWCVFQVIPNSVTGLTPLEAQNAYIDIKQDFPAGYIKIIGYGREDDPNNQAYNYASQGNSGYYKGSSFNNTYFKFSNYVVKGVSGAPLIDKTDGKAVGIATAAECGYAGYNGGTSFFNQNFWQAAGVVHVVVEQRKANGSSFGNIEHWEEVNGSPDFKSYASGTTFIFSNGSQETFRAQQDVVDNQKYHDWNNASDVTNHHTFTINMGTQTLLAQFKDIQTNIEIRNYLESAGVQNSGNIYFKDPWLIDYADPAFNNEKRNQGMAAPFKARPLPFIPDAATAYNGDVHKGVFLNQGFPNWAPPYYSLSSPPQVIPFHGKNITWYLDAWEGNSDSVAFQSPEADTTAVVFKTPGATVTARLKGHLVSDQNGGMRYVVQRHIAYQNGTWYMMYRDGGRLYVSTSSDGVSWSREKRISGSLQNCDHAHIAAGMQTGYVYVVWERSLGNNQYEVYFSRTTDGGNTWDVPKLIATVSNSYPQAYGPQPVIAEMRTSSNIEPYGVQGSNNTNAPPPQYTYHTVLVYVTSSGLKWHYSSTQGSNWSPQRNIPVPSTTSVWFPSIASGGDFIALAYSFRSNSYEVTTRVFDGNAWSAAANVSGIAGRLYDRLPNIGVTHSGNLIIGWHAHDNSGQYRVLLRRGYSNNTWQSQVEEITPHGTVNEWHPSVNFWNNEEVDVVWFDDNHTVYRRQYNNGFSSYTESILSNNGLHAHLPQFRPGDYATAFVTWTEKTGQPYLIQTTAGVSYTSNKMTQVATVLEGREAIVAQAGLVQRFRLGRVNLDETPVGFEPLPGAIPVTLTVGDVGRYVRTEAFTIDGHGSIGFQAGVENDGGVVDSVTVVENTVSSRPAVGYAELVNGSGEVVWRQPLSNGEKTYHLPVALLPAGTYYLRIQVEQGGADARVGIREMHRIAAPTVVSETSPQGEVTLDRDAALPQKYDLQPAYPNPFNPSTTIGYALPEASEVALEVYNVQGQRIRELVGGRQPAGWHAVVWDGRNSNGKPVPSGVYVVRMTAHPVRGSGNAFVASRKVVLMK